MGIYIFKTIIGADRVNSLIDRRESRFSLEISAETRIEGGTGSLTDIRLPWIGRVNAYIVE